MDTAPLHAIVSFLTAIFIFIMFFLQQSNGYNTSSCHKFVFRQPFLFLMFSKAQPLYAIPVFSIFSSHFIFDTFFLRHSSRYIFMFYFLHLAAFFIRRVFSEAQQ